MATSESSSMDIYKTIRVIRGHAEAIQHKENDSLDNVELLPDQGVSIGNRKILNIPVTDVGVDEDYENYNKPTYTISLTYIKHIKRLVDDADVSTDYHADQEDLIWLAQQSKRFTSDKLTLNTFEQAINLLERANGTTRDTISQTVALRILSEKSGLSQSFVNKQLPDIYKYWTGKRDKQNKPLCRRYWPTIPASDTNPHQVFRVRDKERYRLRRQYRKNDLEAFKKLQQLRKEFSQARHILQLIIERESLCDAQFNIKEMIFNCERQALEDKSSVSYSTTMESYEPRFKHLWMPATSAFANVKDYESRLLEMEFDDDSIEEQELAEMPFYDKKTQGKPNKVNNKQHTFGDSAGDLLLDKKRRRRNNNNNNSERVYIYGDSGNVIEVTDDLGRGSGVSLSRGIQKRSASTETVRPNPEDTFPGYSRPSIFSSEAFEEVEHVDVIGNTKLIHDQVEGPKEVCRPLWPSYLTPFPPRDNVFYEANPSDYLDSLQLKIDDSLEYVAPTKYRVRHRIGRGGRVIADRIPVYFGNIDSTEDSNLYDEIIYQQPVQLRPHHSNRSSVTAPPALVKGLKNTFPSLASTIPAGLNALAGHQSPDLDILGVSVGVNGSSDQQPRTSSNIQQGQGAPRVLSEVPLSNRKIFNNLKKAGRGQYSTYIWSNCAVPTFNTIPPLVPPGKITISAEKADRLAQILNENDSEDEKIVFQHQAGKGRGSGARGNHSTDYLTTKFILPV